MEILEEIEYEVNEDDLSFDRLDTLLVKRFPQFSRSFLKQLFTNGNIKADKKLSLSKLPAFGTKIQIQVPFPEDSELKAENIPIEILYEDEYLLFVNKPAGMVVHPAPGHYTGTLVHALLYHCTDLQGIGQVKRPGIVHRLDKGTSGVMVVAKEQKTHEMLVELFREHNLKRQYQALCYKSPMLDSGKIEAKINRHPKNRKKMTSKTNLGKDAVTYYKVLERFKNTSEVELTLETGRTHQIRVHLSERLNCPILNDYTYANVSQHLKNIKKLKEVILDYEHPFLHAKHLSFKHPKTAKQLSFDVSPPKIYLDTLKLLKES